VDLVEYPGISRRSSPRQHLPGQGVPPVPGWAGLATTPCPASLVEAVKKAKGNKQQRKEGRKKKEKWRGIMRSPILIIF